MKKILLIILVFLLAPALSWAITLTADNVRTSNIVDATGITMATPFVINQPATAVDSGFKMNDSLGVQLMEFIHDVSLDQIEITTTKPFEIVSGVFTIDATSIDLDGSADVSLTSSTGDITMGSGSGDVSAITTSGTVLIASSSGTVTVRGGSTGGLTLASQSGTISVTANLSLDSTTKVLRLPRLTTVQRDALTPLNGMTIFNTTTLQEEVYSGTAWVGATELDEWTELSDTPSSVSAGLVVQGNSGGTALEFGQNLTTTGTPTFGALTVTGTFKDSSGDVGTSGQILSSTLTGTNWIAEVGDVSSTGIPLDNQIAVWTGASTIEGTTGLTFDGSTFDIAVSSGNVTQNITTSGTANTAGLFLFNDVGKFHGFQMIGSTATGTFAGVTLANIAKFVTSADNLVFGTQTASPIVFISNLTEQMRLTSAGDFGVGTGSTVSAKLHTLSITEQLRLGYDAANYTSFTVSSGGDLTIAPTGSDTNITGNLTVDTNTLFVNSTNNKVGIGTIDPSNTGSAMLELEGTASNVVGPHIQAITSTDQYPVYQNLNWSHDNITLSFDSYFDGSWKSSDLGSNFKMSKLDDLWQFDYANSIAAGSVISWNTGFVIDAFGNIGVNLKVPLAKFHVLETTEQLRLAYDVTNYASFTVSSGGDLTIAPTGGGTVITGTINNATLNDDATFFNLILGTDAGASITDAANTTAIGHQASNANLSADNTTAVGYQALFANITGASNTAVGSRSMQVNTAGFLNTAVGDLTLSLNTSGNSNTAIGAFSLVANITGDSNTAIGKNTLAALTVGKNNVALGDDAGKDLNPATGEGNNTFIGTSTGGGIVTGVDNTILGANVVGLSSTLSNNIIIADGLGVIRLQFDSSGDGTIGGSLTVDGQTVSLVSSEVHEIFSAAEYEALGTASVITTSTGTNALDFKVSVTSTTRHSITARTAELMFIDETESNGVIYISTSDFITSTVGGDVTFKDVTIVAGIEGTQLFNYAGSGSLSEVDVISFHGTTALVGWDLGTISRVSTTELGPIVTFKDGSILFNTAASLVLDSVSIFGLNSTYIDQADATGFGGPIISFKDSAYKGGRATLFTLTGNLYTGESLVRVDAGLPDDYRVNVFNTNLVYKGTATIFDTSGTTGTFTVVANNSISATAITGVTDSSDVASFTVASAPLLGSLTTVSGFTTNTSYNTTGIVTARTATTFEIDYVAFGTTEVGSYLVTGVTVTSTAHGLTQGTGVTLDTTLSTDYDGGFLIYNIQTNSFDVPATFTLTKAGGWSTKGLDETDPRIIAKGNPGQADSQVIAFGFTNGNTDSITITNGTYAAIDASTFSENAVTQRFKLTNATTALFELTALEDFEGFLTGSLTAVKSGSTADYRFAMSTNGSIPVFASANYVPMEVKTTKVNVALLFSVNLSKGDTIQIMVAGDGTSDSLTITDLVFGIQ